MSLKSWQAEFYSKAAKPPYKEDILCVLHSLKKWLGLTPANFIKHNLCQYGEIVIEHNPTYASPGEAYWSGKCPSFIVDDTTCMLCQDASRKYHEVVGEFETL